MTNGTLAHSPPLALLALEPVRAALEFAASRLAAHEHLPPGDGHPVVIFPGLAADKMAVGPLRGFCERLGYAASDWGRGVNTGPKGGGPPPPARGRPAGMHPLPPPRRRPPPPPPPAAA